MEERISIFIPSAQGGGVERIAVTLANGFAARGLLVDLVLAKADGAFLAEVGSNVRIVNLDSNRVLSSVIPLARYLRAVRPNAMLSAMNYVNVVALTARLISGVPTRLIASEHSTITMNRSSRPALFYDILLQMMRWTYSRADGVVAVSAGVADDLAVAIKFPRKRIKVIYNPVVSMEMVAKAKKPIEHPWFLSGSAPVVLGVGRLNAAKDFATLIRAFARLRAERPCRLLILGEGELREKLEQLISELGLNEDVALPGFTSNPYAFMSRAAVFVLSSAWEGLPTVLIEAMACGVPVVSTNCPNGPEEILENGRWGALVPVGNIEKLAIAIMETLDKDPKPNVVVRARDFGAAQAIDAYLNILLK